VVSFRSGNEQMNALAIKAAIWYREMEIDLFSHLWRNGRGCENSLVRSRAIFTMPGKVNEKNVFFSALGKEL